MIKPYFSADGITIYNGSALDILPALMHGGCRADLILTDPPYSEQTHNNAITSDPLRKNKFIKAPIDFAPITNGQLAELFDVFGALASGWVVSFCDWKHCAKLDEKPPRSLRFVRAGVWVKSNPTPQLTGDRPGQGFESIAYLHADQNPVGSRKLGWNGGGKSGSFTGPSDHEGLHPTAKPQWLCDELIQRHSDRGDLVIDPFMGSGTTLRAALSYRRRAIGIEINPAYCDVAVRRLQQKTLF